MKKKRGLLIHLENISRKPIPISDVELGGGRNNRLIREERSKKGKMWLPEGNTEGFTENEKQAKEWAQYT